MNKIIFTGNKTNFIPFEVRSLVETACVSLLFFKVIFLNYDN